MMTKMSSNLLPRTTCRRTLQDNRSRKMFRSSRKPTSLQNKSNRTRSSVAVTRRSKLPEQRHHSEPTSSKEIEASVAETTVARKEDSTSKAAAVDKKVEVLSEITRQGIIINSVAAEAAVETKVQSGAVERSSKIYSDLEPSCIPMYP